MAARARLRGAALRVAGIGGAVALVIAGGVNGYSRLTRGAEAAVAPVSAQRESAVTEAPARSFAVTQSGELAQPAVATTRVDSPATAPTIPTGRIALANGFSAERTGDTVIVDFDTQEARTRRSDKFEAVVRETIPAVFGDAGRRAVDRLQPGALVQPGQLLAAIDGAPLVLPVGDGRTIRIIPRARAGRDGPLVVRYDAVMDAAASAAAS